MTVKALIQELLDCDMDAEVQFGTKEGDFNVTGVLCGKGMKEAGSITLDHESVEEEEIGD